jgi:hypothetical protein
MGWFKGDSEDPGDFSEEEGEWMEPTFGGESWGVGNICSSEGDSPIEYLDDADAEVRLFEAIPN